MSDKTDDSKEGRPGRRSPLLSLAGAPFIVSFLLLVLLSPGKLYFSPELLVFIYGLGFLCISSFAVIIERDLSMGVKAPAIEEAQEPRGSSIFLIPLLGILIPLVFGLMIVPNFLRARVDGTLTACKSNLKNVGTSLEMCSTDYNGDYPPDLSFITPNYLKVIPTCPNANRSTYTYRFISRTIHVRGQLFEGPGDQVNFKKQFAPICFLVSPLIS